MSTITSTPAAPACHKCNGAVVVIQKKAGLSAAGMLGALLFIVSLPVMLFHFVAGLVLLAVAVLISTLGRPSSNWLKCTACGAERKL